MEQGQKISGSEAVIKVLAAHGVNTVFGYPGGAIMPIYDALYDSQVEHLLSRHEQAPPSPPSVMPAQAARRASAWPPRVRGLPI